MDRIIITRLAVALVGAVAITRLAGLDAAGLAAWIAAFGWQAKESPGLLSRPLDLLVKTDRMRITFKLGSAGGVADCSPGVAAGATLEVPFDLHGSGTLFRLN